MKIPLSWRERSGKKHKAFAANPLGEIRYKNDIEIWFYCPREFNAADLIALLKISKHFNDKRCGNEIFEFKIPVRYCVCLQSITL